MNRTRPEQHRNSQTGNSPPSTQFHFNRSRVAARPQPPVMIGLQLPPEARQANRSPQMASSLILRS
ncbi:hypothetical protein BDV33DRAFT_175311 [Aspergillus novoparasiticus]|uniref:Uncharacterized protein n=1 Tax=Aspergillus novoparasiticus TaxID=986946 RepID=A0A5N6EM99_9EURO|nr:hypothetical protein BDV33DRAFT_175311 [Aspergillus novoparasiticus]